MQKKFAPTRRKIVMAAPLDIIQSPKKVKAFRFKASRCSPRRISSPHPLDSYDNEEYLSESETDSFLESSYNESISSTTTNESWCASFSSVHSYSWNLQKQWPVSLEPVVSTLCIAAYSPKSLPNTSGTSSKLTQLLKDSQNMELDDGEATKSTSKFPYTFPKPSKLSAWQAFSAFFINYSMRSAYQKDSGESFPESSPKSISQAEDQESGEHMEEELATFGEYTEDKSCEVVFHRSKARNREHRVNSEFLKRYAMDCNARLNGVLPVDPTDLAMLLCRPSIRNFDENYGLNRLSEMSRDKLWNSVILPPRRDPCPRSVIDSETYVFSPEETRRTSIVSKYSNKLPWATHQSSMKPAGRFRASACLKSNASPTLGHSTPQYTVKGWQNERWTPLSAQS